MEGREKRVSHSCSRITHLKHGLGAGGLSREAWYQAWSFACSLNPPNSSETALCYPHFAAGVTSLQKGTQGDSAETEQLGR